MKSLNEEIKQVKESKCSNSKKVMCLIKLGLQEIEASEFVQNWAAESRATKARKKYTFGVEIECMNAERSRIERQLVSNKVEYNFERYNHTDNKYYYKFVSDASIRGQNPIECVSPILSGKNGKQSLKACCEALNKAGARVNKSCGLHVHIGASDMKNEQYISVFVNYKHLESVIDKFMALSRRGNNSQWCRTIQNIDFESCATIADVRYAFSCDRYYKVNAMSYERHKTIEFRQHQGTTDYEKISRWVDFCGKLVLFSKSNRLAADIESIDEIPFLDDEEKEFFKQRAAILA